MAETAMAHPEAEIASRSIVLVGRFNPGIFHPQWFVRMGLIPSEEADKAEVKPAPPQVSSFELDWFQCLVTQDHFQVSTLRPEMDYPLLDLVAGTFAVLNHTPVWQFGINADSHFAVDSEEVWHGIGHRLSPKKIWDDVLLDPGTRVVVIQGKRRDGFAGSVNVRVEPSLTVHPGVYVNVNDHVDLRDDAPRTWSESLRWVEPEVEWLSGAGPALTALQDVWPSSLQQADRIYEKVMRRY